MQGKDEARTAERELAIQQIVGFQECAELVIEHIACIRIQLPTSCPEGGVVQSRRARPPAVRSMSRGAACPDEPPTGQINPRRVAQRVASHRSSRSDTRRAPARQMCKNAPRHA
jgi:hypothetical protein